MVRRLPHLAVSLALAVALAATGCAGGGGETGGQTTEEPPGTVPATTAADAGPAPGGPPATATLEGLAALRVTLTEVATFDAPVAMAQRPGHDDVFFVAERAGQVRVLDAGGAQPEPMVEVETTTDGERGLLGLAFSPDGDHLYVSYTNLEGDSRLEEYAMGAGAADVDIHSRRTLLRVAQPFANHNGGHVTFGPDDLLYFGLGDGGGAGDPMDNAQDTTTLLGSLLRIDPRPDGDAPYGIPADNPFTGGGGRGEIFAYGLRNPWRFSFDRATDDLWIADVGQNAIEEVNLLPEGTAAGANLGWPALEGTRPFDGDPPPDAVPPVYEYTHDEGFSVTGGFVYRGERIPGLQGAYVFGDLGTAEIWALAVDDHSVVGRQDLGVGVDEGTLVSFFEDVAGELYVISIAGTISRLDPA
ncbi:MAG: PQQ-dependent sugar dehydrogenase [Acidimicrobiales bacterium]